MKGIWHLSTDTTVANFMAHVSELRLAGKPVRVKLLPEKRSLDQNDMTWALYTQIAGQAEDQTVAEIRAECKLRFGVPILRAKNESFRAMYNKAILHTLTYEEKLAAMEFLPVTRIMTTPQCTEYIDTIIREYSKQGYALTPPGEELRYG